MYEKGAGQEVDQQGLRGFNSDESIRDVLAQRGCRVPRLRSPLYLFTAYLTGADAAAGFSVLIQYRRNFDAS